MGVRRSAPQTKDGDNSHTVSQEEVIEENSQVENSLGDETDEKTSDEDDDRNSNSDSAPSAGAAGQQSPDESEATDDSNARNMNGRQEKLRKSVDWIQTARYACGNFVNHPKVQLFIVTLIAINAAMMGIATFEFVRENPDVLKGFQTADLVFLIIFTVELCMQFIYRGWRLLTDGWLLFDLIVIATSWGFSEIRIIRAFRIFRALRLITRIKVMKNLVLALFGVMPRMFAIGLLLFLVSYIFAVMFTQLFKDLWERGLTDTDYFGRIDTTFFTLFQIMTLDSWADIARQVMDVYSWAWLPFIVFVIITGFVVVNLIIAVICDAISALHDDEKAKLHGTFEDDDGSSEHEDSVHPALHEDVRMQLDVLEDSVDELTRMQEQTLATLDALTRHLQPYIKDSGKEGGPSVSMERQASSDSEGDLRPG